MEWTRWWKRMPRLRVTLARPGRETNPLAERVMEALHRATETASNAIEGFRSANESLQTANESLRGALALIAELQGQADRAREELRAYFLGSMEQDCQVAELERLWTLERPRKDV